MLTVLLKALLTQLRMDFSALRTGGAVLLIQKIFVFAYDDLFPCTKYSQHRQTVALRPPSLLRIINSTSTECTTTGKRSFYMELSNASLKWFGTAD